MMIIFISLMIMVMVIMKLTKTLLRTTTTTTTTTRNVICWAQFIGPRERPFMYNYIAYAYIFNDHGCTLRASVPKLLE
jgi:hypothetical protein